MTEKNIPKRRIVKSPKSDKPKYEVSETVVVPKLDMLLNDATAIIGAELSRYLSKTSRGITLDLKEARAVQGYMETLVKLSRESREAARAHDLSNLNDDELAQLAQQVLGKELKPKVINSEKAKPPQPEKDTE